MAPSSSFSSSAALLSLSVFPRPLFDPEDLLSSLAFSFLVVLLVVGPELLPVLGKY